MLSGRPERFEYFLAQRLAGVETVGQIEDVAGVLLSELRVLVRLCLSGFRGADLIFQDDDRGLNVSNRLVHCSGDLPEEAGDLRESTEALKHRDGPNAQIDHALRKRMDPRQVFSEARFEPSGARIKRSHIRSPVLHPSVQPISAAAQPFGALIDGPGP